MKRRFHSLIKDLCAHWKRGERETQGWEGEWKDGKLAVPESKDCPSPALQRHTCAHPRKEKAPALSATWKKRRSGAVQHAVLKTGETGELLLSVCPCTYPSAPGQALHSTAQDVELPPTPMAFWPSASGRHAAVNPARHRRCTD